MPKKGNGEMSLRIDASGNSNVYVNTSNVKSQSSKMTGMAIALALVTAPNADAFVKSSEGVPPISVTIPIDSVKQTKEVSKVPQIDVSILPKRSKAYEINSSYIKPENVRYEYEFVANFGKKYTMFYVNNSKDPDLAKDKQVITDIYIVPEDFKAQPNKKQGKDDLNMPPKVVNYVIHRGEGMNRNYSIVFQETRCDEKGKKVGTFEYGVKLPRFIDAEIFHLLHDPLETTGFKLEGTLGNYNKFMLDSSTPDLVPEHKVK